MTIDAAIDALRVMLQRGRVRLARLSPMGRDVAEILRERGEVTISGGWVRRV